MSTAKVSRHQQKFLTTTLYKRSRQYFDIHRLNKLEQQLQLSRRIPYDDSTPIDIKIQQNFYNTNIKMYQKVHNDIEKYQTKYNTQCQDQDQIQTDYSITNVKKSKTIDMNKMIPREYFDKERDNHKNESHFCNFKPYLPSRNQTVDFQKFLIPGKVVPIWKRIKPKACFRCKNLSVNPEKNELTTPQIKQIRERLIFDESLFKTKTDYKKYDKEKSGREQQKTIQVNLDRVYLGQKLTRKNQQKGQVEFYHGKTKWSASQMDNRLMKQNEYYISLYKKQDEQKIQWSYLKRKNDLEETRKKEILMRKKIKDIKGEICDELYFRRNK